MISLITLAVTCLVGLVWMSRHLLISRENRKGPPLGPEAPGPPASAPRISVIVAAKDEQDNIETCLRTLMEQDYPDFEVLVCNDRSEDGTGAIVERIAAEDARVRLLNIDRLPDGWYGKSHAMHVGIADTRSEWICMIDADCRQTSPRTLSVAVQYAIDHGADLLSVLPTMEMRGFWENVVQPICGGVMMIWFNPDKVNDPRRPNAYANGAFILMKRTAYDAIGGHEAIKGCASEDMHLARQVKSSGLNLRVVRSAGLYLVRMYTSLGQIVRGWTRIFFGTFGTFRRLIVSLLVVSVMGLVPYLAGALGFALAASGAGPMGLWLACGIAGAAAAAMQLSVIFRFYRIAGGRRALAWTYPLGCLVVLAILVIAIAKLRPGARLVWRGTSYQTP